MKLLRVMKEPPCPELNKLLEVRWGRAALGLEVGSLSHPSVRGVSLLCGL